MELFTSNKIFHVGFLIFFVCNPVSSLRVTGKWKSENVYKFLAKFAFQKTEVDEIETTRGYIFGNVTRSLTKFNSFVNFPPATLVIVDGEYVTDLYGNASRPLQYFGNISDESQESLWRAETARCRAMFSRIDSLAWNRKCQPSAKMDFFRQVPCASGGVCSEEDDRSRVIPSSQFTFTVQDMRQPRYWYLSLIACFRNETTCQWESSLWRSDSSANKTLSACKNPSGISSTQGDDSSTKDCIAPSVDYDIWMVNGVPRLQDYYRFEHQFSFEDYDLFEIYLVLSLLYFLLSVVFHMKYKGEFEPLSVLLFCHIWLSFLSATLQAIHLSIFSFNGHGVPQLQSMGGVVGRSAEAFLLILLITTADVGFPIFPAELSHFERKVRRYRKRQFLRVHSLCSDMSAERRSKLSYPENSATWTACRSKTSDWQPASVLPKSSSDYDFTAEGDSVTTNLSLMDRGDPFAVLLFGRFKCSFLKYRACVYLVSMLFVFMMVELGFYIWALCDQDPVLDISVWNTTPGRLLVATRFAISFWFLNILRTKQKLNLAQFNGVIDPLHFAASFLLWLLSLPVVVFLAETSVSPLWRRKTVVGVTYFFDFVASILFVQLINRSNAYSSR